LYNIINN